MPSDVEATVLVMCRRRCCICFGLNRDTGLKTGQIAHLDRNPANAGMDNLAFLCLTHHDEYDSKTSQRKGLTTNEVRRFRIELHEAIERAWKERVRFGEVHAVTDTGVAGRYVREGDIDTAELQVEVIAGKRIRVRGLALWGTHRESPRMGEVEFEGEIDEYDQSITFFDELEGDTYRLKLTFLGDALAAHETYVIGYFGMNVQFEGIYRKLPAA